MPLVRDKVENLGFWTPHTHAHTRTRWAVATGTHYYFYLGWAEGCPHPEQSVRRGNQSRHRPLQPIGGGQRLAQGNRSGEVGRVSG